MVALTTTDYIAYDDVHGIIEDITIRNVFGNNHTRTVLVGGSALGGSSADGHYLRDIVIDGAPQTRSGAAVSTGGSGNSDFLYNLAIRGTRGGSIQRKHPNHTNVTIEDARTTATSSLVTVSPDGTNAGNNISRLVVRDIANMTGSGNVISAANAATVIDDLTMETSPSARRPRRSTSAAPPCAERESLA